ncbi:MAG: alpha-hydroxy-acid oxidizing protein [Treponema sp.]|nr:alpha-hydroxy-acid oxidizing protein [Treponema sp.]
MQQVCNILCKQCTVCMGFGCIGEMPGMGGVNNNENFQLNCKAWKEIRSQINENEISKDKIKEIKIDKKNVYIAPVTGAEQNIGYKNEEDFYEPYVTSASKAGIGISLGDGYPDEKLQFGINAVKNLQKTKSDAKVAVFLKPYPNNVLFERIEYCEDVAEIIGNDIDAYNIATMRNVAHLEKKTVASIAELRKRIRVPYALKGVFTQEDIELVKETLPDIVVISNHGGRIETEKGSTANFLKQHGKMLKNYCNQIWVDGGIRSREDIQTAFLLGADKVMIARPFIISLAVNGIDGMIKTIENIT